MGKFWQSKTVGILGIIGLALLAAVIALLLSIGYAQQQIPVSLGGFGSVFTDYWSKGHVVLEGTWIIEDEQQAFPLQTSKIRCLRAKEECVESRAEISGTTMVVHQDTYDISRWDEHILIYTHSYPCVDYVYTVSRDTKQVSGIRKIKAGMEKDCPDHAKELKLRLTKGFDVYWELLQEARPKTATMVALMCILFWAVFRIRKIIKSQPPVLQ